MCRQAENGRYVPDPKPDLDNANVGIYGESSFIENVFCRYTYKVYLFFFHDNTVEWALCLHESTFSGLCASNGLP